LEPYGEGNGRWRAGDDSAALPVFNDGEGGALAPRFTLAAVVQVEAPPPSIESAQEVLARWIDGGGLEGKRRFSFCKKMLHEGSPIYRGFDTHTWRIMYPN
jgi:hypothetical protein